MEELRIEKLNPGPKGEAGPQVPQKEKGKPGPKGDLWSAGETGANGDKEEIGQVGPRGDKGELGQVGPQGNPGLAAITSLPSFLTDQGDTSNMSGFV